MSNFTSHSLPLTSVHCSPVKNERWPAFRRTSLSHYSRTSRGPGFAAVLWEGVIPHRAHQTLSLNFSYPLCRSTLPGTFDIQAAARKRAIQALLESLVSAQSSSLQATSDVMLPEYYAAQISASYSLLPASGNASNDSAINRIGKKRVFGSLGQHNGFIPTQNVFFGFLVFPSKVKGSKTFTDASRPGFPTPTFRLASMLATLQVQILPDRYQGVGSPLCHLFCKDSSSRRP